MQARNQLRRPGGAKSFLRELNFLNYVQHIFPGGRGENNFRTPWYGPAFNPFPSKLALHSHKCSTSQNLSFDLKVFTFKQECSLRILTVQINISANLRPCPADRTLDRTPPAHGTPPTHEAANVTGWMNCEEHLKLVPPVSCGSISSALLSAPPGVLRTFGPVVLKWGYAFPFGYAKVLQGVQGTRFFNNEILT